MAVTHFLNCDSSLLIPVVVVPHRLLHHIMPTLPELRVAEQEVQSSHGPVYVQLSPGAVAFLEERTTVEARVSRQLQAAIAKDQVTDPTK